MSDAQELTFFKTFEDASSTIWETPHAKRGWTAEIDFDKVTRVYTLTITGSGAPAPSEHATLRLAKNGFRKALFTRPVS